MKNSCDNCLWFDRKGYENKEGKCRRYPNTKDKVSVIKSDNWCGEHECNNWINRFLKL